MKDNLKLVFPHKSSEEINTIAKGFYKHLCDIIFETLKSMTISEKEIKKRFRFKNLEKHEIINEAALVFRHIICFRLMLYLKRYR